MKTFDEIARLRRDGRDTLVSPEGAMLFQLTLRPNMELSTEEIAERIREVLIPVVEAVNLAANDDCIANVQLPKWFDEKFQAPKTKDEWEAIAALPLETKLKLGEESWDREGWLYWFKSENREWKWWGSAVSEQHIEIALHVDGWPFPWGALRWLIRCAGAESIE